MEKKLKALFDFQKFQGNPRLAKMIADAEKSVDGELSDDELFLVAAAGETDTPKKEDACHDS